MNKSVGKVEITIAELVAAFPAAFTLDRTLVRPVKLGIKDDLYGQSAISHRRITAALRSYCNSVHYLRASTEGTVRIDLAGEPAGTVTATQARHATERLAALAKIAAKRASKVARDNEHPNAQRHRQAARRRVDPGRVPPGRPESFRAFRLNPAERHWSLPKRWRTTIRD